MSNVIHETRFAAQVFFPEFRVDYDPERAAQPKTHSQVLVYRELPLSVVLRTLFLPSVR